MKVFGLVFDKEFLSDFGLFGELFFDVEEVSFFAVLGLGVDGFEFV